MLSRQHHENHDKDEVTTEDRFPDAFQKVGGPDNVPKLSKEELSTAEVLQSSASSAMDGLSRTITALDMDDGNMDSDFKLHVNPSLVIVIMMNVLMQVRFADDNICTASSNEF